MTGSRGNRRNSSSARTGRFPPYLLSQVGQTLGRSGRGSYLPANESAFSHRGANVLANRIDRSFNRQVCAVSVIIEDLPSSLDGPVPDIEANARRNAIVVTFDA